MEEKIVYVVTAHRTTKSQHSYVVGVYENAEDAVEAMQTEVLNRRMKYTARVSQYVLNQQPEDLTNSIEQGMERFDAGINAALERYNKGMESIRKTLEEDND